MCGRIPNTKRHNRLRTPDGTGCSTDNASSLQFPSCVMSKELVEFPYKHGMETERHAYGVKSPACQARLGAFRAAGLGD